MDVELLAAAGLIAAADSRGRVTESWTPTADADDFLDGPDEAAWAQIAAVWLDLRRNPSRVGSRDASDKVQNALSPELSWIRGPAERRFVLTALAELPPGSGLDLDALSARLAWRSPLRPAEQRDAVLRRDDRRGHRAGRGRLHRADHRRAARCWPGRPPVPRPHCEAALPDAGGHRDGAGRPDGRRTRPAGPAAGRPARPGRRCRIGRQRHRVPGDPAVDPAGAGRRGVDRRTARTVHRALGDRRAAGADLPDRRRRPPVRRAAARQGQHVPAQRRSGADRPGRRRGVVAGHHAAQAGADRRDLHRGDAGTDDPPADRRAGAGGRGRQRRGGRPAAATAADQAAGAASTSTGASRRCRATSSSTR